MSSFQGDDSGSVTVLFAVSAIALLGFVGLAVDYSVWIDKKSRMQSYADAAALAGAAILSDDPSSAGQAEQIASAMLSTDIETASGGVTPIVHADTLSKTVRIQLSGPGPRTMSGLFLHHDPLISVSSVAKGKSGMPMCILALDPSMNGALLASGGTDVLAQDCKVQVNSTSASAVTFSGGSTLTAGENCFVGGVSQGLAQMSPKPKKPCPAVADPFAGYQTPAVGACDHTKFKVSGGSPVLSPGVYCGGLTLSSVTTATFQPGVYIIKDGLFTMSGGGRLEGQDVSMFLTGSNAGLNWSGGGSYHLTAPSSGDLAGFLVFLDPAATAASKSVISGSGEMYYEGILYFPDQQVEVSGGGMTLTNTSPWAMYVAKNFVYSGGSQLIVNLNPIATTVLIPPEISQMGGDGPLLVQ
jgi:hypothetical protein